MKTVLVLCALLAVVLSRPEEAYYNTQYDNFDANELVQNVRLLKSYGKCFLDQGPCTAEGSDFKKTIPDALKTTCAKCTPKQRVLIRTVVNAFKTKLPETWDKLIEKNDPNGEFKKEFDAFIDGTD